MQLNPYLSFNGQCEEAFKFYEKALGAKILSMFRYEGMPAEYQTSPEWKDKIMHARIEIANTTVMGSDAPPGRYQVPQGVQLSIGVNDPSEAERIFNGLAEGGQIQMPMQQTFWALRFGMLVDRFSVSWMVNCEQAPSA